MVTRPFTVDATLSAVAIAYTNSALSRIADQVMPRVDAGSEKFKWMEYPLEEAFQIPDARVGRRGRVQQMEFTGTEKTDSVEDYGLDVPIPYSDIDEAARQRAAKLSSHDPEKHSVMMLEETIQNIREVRVAQMIHNPASYAPARQQVLVGTDQFTDYASSDPITVIKDAMNSTLVFRPNTMVISRYGLSKLNSHPKIVNAVRGGNTTDGIVSVQQLVDLFSGEGLQNILVGEAHYNAAKPGQAVDLQQAWGKHISFLHINPLANTQPGNITFGYTAQLGTKFAGRIMDQDIGLEGGVRIRSGEKLKELIVARDVGFFLENAFQ
ncbi:MAG: capsid protein [Pseudomonadota bacterium]